MKDVRYTQTEIDHDQARQLLACNTYAGQRKLQPAKVRHLTNEFNTGGFLNGDVAVATRTDGKQVLMNGQHQLNAFLLSEQSSMNVSLREFTFEDNGKADSVQESELFSKIDCGQDRTKSEIVKTKSVAFEYDHIKISNLIRIVDALNFLEHGPSYGSLRKPEQASILADENLREDVEFGSQMIGRSKGQPAPNHVRMHSVLAAAIGHRRHHGTIITESFWQMIRDGADPIDQPDVCNLRDYLIRQVSKEPRRRATKVVIVKRCDLQMRKYVKSLSS